MRVSAALVVVTTMLVPASSFRALRAAEAPATASSDYVWWEGEDAFFTNFPKNNPFGARHLAENARLLSGGEWLNATGKDPGTGGAFVAKWKVTVPADGEFNFWVRKFWKHGPFKWRFLPAGGGAGAAAEAAGECGPNAALADDTPLKKHVNANWVSLGNVTLAKGEKLFEAELVTQPGKDWGAAFDCFVLSREPFSPSGKAKPGEKAAQADEGYFAFDPPLDKFTPDALLDLRSLNEKAAGQSGFLKRSGASFALGDGTPVRFWAVNVKAENAGQGKAAVDYMARKLAKAGVNMVRYHSPVWDSADPSKVDAKKLDELFYMVHALKREGIYTCLSFYFPVWVDASQPGFGLAGYPVQGNKRPFALLFFDPHLQKLHQGWLRQLLTTPSPYGGQPLAKEPAVGIVELLNEDSFFFWTFSHRNVPDAKWRDLERLFAKWVLAKYGSVERAHAAWHNVKDPNDSPDRVIVWEAPTMTGKMVPPNAPVGRIKRVGDQTRFLAELQRGFYEAGTKYVKQDLGYGGLVSASNWTVADPAMTGAIERWTYTATDVIDQHGYFQGEHKGDGAEFSVRAGHTFKDAAAVRWPTVVPLRFQQIADFPQITSEIGFPQPNRTRADGVFLSSAYASLQGVDGLFFFALDSNYVRDTSIRKFQVADPVVAGAFPAAALSYRRGDVRQAEPTVSQVLNLDDLFAMKGSGGWAADAMDEFRKKDIPAGAAMAGPVEKFDAFAPYVGPVVRSFGADVKSSQARDLTPFVDRERKVITSGTKELSWRYEDGLVTLNAPRAQGAAGFLAKAGGLALGDVTVELANEFGSVTAVSLDGEPVASSRRVLVQVMTQAQPTGFRAEGDKIVELGGPPFGVKKVKGSVELRFASGGGTPQVVALDENGYATKKPVAVQAGSKPGAVRVTLAEDVVYYVVTR